MYVSFHFKKLKLINLGEKKLSKLATVHVKKDVQSGSTKRLTNENKFLSSKQK